MISIVHNSQICPEKLYQVVGHEMQHADHFRKGGLFWIWRVQHGGGPAGEFVATQISEMYAWQWNMENYNKAPYEGALNHFLDMWEKAYKSILSFYGAEG